MFKKRESRKFSFIIALISIVFGLFGLFFSSYQIYAANINAGVLNITFAGDQLFNNINIAPGDEIIKNVTVTNTGTLPHSFSIATSGVTGSLADVLEIEPRINGAAVWTKTLAQIAQNPNSTIIIHSIDPNQSVNVEFVAKLPASVGNSAMNTATSNFSFYFGNESTDTSEPFGTQGQPSMGLTGVSNQLVSSNSGRSQYGFYGAGSTETSADNSGSNPSTPDSGQVNGEKTDVKGIQDEIKQSSFWWWWILLIIILILAFLIYWFYYRRRRKDEEDNKTE